jgi:hypothetical protein
VAQALARRIKDMPRTIVEGRDRFQFNISLFPSDVASTLNLKIEDQGGAIQV